MSNRPRALWSFDIRHSSFDISIADLLWADSPRRDTVPALPQFSNREVPMDFFALFRDRLVVTAGMWLASCGPAWWNSVDWPEPVVAAAPAKQPFAALRVDRPDPALMKILQEWESTSAKITRIDCSFRRFTYDSTFEFDKRAEGELSIETQSRARYVFRPAAIARGAESRKKNPRGQRYEIVADKPERWHWTGTHVYRIDDEKKTYEAIAIPAEELEPTQQGWFAMASLFCEFPLARPFLLGMPAEEFIRQYRVTLLKDSDSEIWLDIEPRTARIRQFYQRAQFILERPRMLPKAVQILDPTGNKVTVHTFSDMRVNAEGPSLDKVDLTGLRLIRPPAASNTSAGLKPTEANGLITVAGLCVISSLILSIIF
jgi:hypothetical protein